MEDPLHPGPLEGRRHEVPVAGGDAAGEQQHLGPAEPAPEEGGEVRLPVAGGAEGEGEAAGGPHEGLQGRAVAVADARRGEAAGVHGVELVPRHPHGHAGPEVDLGPRRTHGGEHRHGARRHDGARGEGDAAPPRVAPPPVDAGSRRGSRGEEDEGPPVEEARVLAPDHGVGAAGDGGAGHDEGGAAPPLRPAGRGAGEDRLEDRQGLAAAHRGVGGPDGVAVQGRPVEGGLVAVRPHGPGEAEPLRVGQGDPPRAPRRGAGEDAAERLLHGEEPGVVAGQR